MPLKIARAAFVLATVLLAFRSLPTGAADTSGGACPAHLTQSGKFHMLDKVTLFDGPPLGKSEVIAATSGNGLEWDIAASRAAGADPYLLCAFKHTDETRSMPVAPGAKRCWMTRGYPLANGCE